jgi:uncharacterized protein (DUF488 family)
MKSSQLSRAQKGKVYTLGTSQRSLAEFIEILKHYSINQVVDVRSFPQSKRFPHFNKERLERRLFKKGINYVYLGKELGGYRKSGYESHMKTPLFNKGIDELVGLAQEKPTALICAEKFPWRCHRRFISQRLAELSFKIIHILDLDKTWVP